MRDLLCESLEGGGFRVSCVESAVQALHRLRLPSDSTQPESAPNESAANEVAGAADDGGDFDVVLTDVKMPGMDGLEFCRLVKQHRPDLPVVVMTAFGSLETSIQAIRAGAFDFVTKPIELDMLHVVMRRAAEHYQLKQQIKRLKFSQPENEFGQLIGSSDAMRRLKSQLQRIVDVSASVLLIGETGTGKEVVARALHSQGERQAKPFVAVNCGALPATLVESELFGHVKGAFTDARQDRQGLFVQADGGTLFLDEIGELPLELQPKLLRAIEQKTVRPVGGQQEIPFDVRLISATNRDLQLDIEENRFREDLFYRINVIQLVIPPLRTRGTDVILLANHFLREFAAQTGKPVTGIAQPAAARLLQYDWPGNVRELRNVIERAVALTQFNQLVIEDFPEKIVHHQKDTLVVAEHDNQPLATLEEIDNRYIRHVLKQTGGNKTEAAEILGIDRKTLYRKLKDDDA